MQNISRFAHISPNLRQITSTPGANFVINLDSIHLLKGIDNIKYAVWSASTDIEDEKSRVRVISNKLISYVGLPKPCWLF